MDNSNLDEKRGFVWTFFIIYKKWAIKYIIEETEIWY